MDASTAAKLSAEPSGWTGPTNQAEPEPGVHHVKITYYHSKKMCEAEPYPLKGLKVDDIVVFEPEPNGRLKLIFKNGSNFEVPDPKQPATADHPNTSMEIQNGNLVIEGRHDGAVQARVAHVMTENQAAALKVPKDFFPFDCELTVKYTGGVNNPPGKIGG